MGPDLGSSVDPRCRGTGGGGRDASRPKVVVQISRSPTVAKNAPVGLQILFAIAYVEPSIFLENYASDLSARFHPFDDDRDKRDRRPCLDSGKDRRIQD